MKQLSVIVPSLASHSSVLPRQQSIPESPVPTNCCSGCSSSSNSSTIMSQCVNINWLYPQRVSGYYERDLDIGDATLPIFSVCCDTVTPLALTAVRVQQPGGGSKMAKTLPLLMV